MGWQSTPAAIVRCMLLQAETTLNILRPTNISPTISAYAHIYGQHGFNKMLLAPMGCVVLLHNKPDIRQTWDSYAIKRFYIETSREHYKCYKIWVKSTRSMWVADTICFRHKYITMPEVRQTQLWQQQLSWKSVTKINTSKYWQTGQCLAHMTHEHISQCWNKICWNL